MVNLYEYYFTNSGAPYRTTREELASDKEIDLAYQYLISKGLMNVDRQGNQLFLFKPTALGIDYVETKLPHKMSGIGNNIEPDNSAKAFLEW